VGTWVSALVTLLCWTLDGASGLLPRLADRIRSKDASTEPVTNAVFTEGVDRLDGRLEEIATLAKQRAELLPESNALLREIRDLQKGTLNLLRDAAAKPAPSYSFTMTAT